jgi:hypothetical protein
MFTPFWVVGVGEHVTASEVVGQVPFPTTSSTGATNMASFLVSIRQIAEFVAGSRVVLP